MNSSCFDFWSFFFKFVSLFIVYFYSDDFYAAQTVFDGVCGVLNSLYFDFGLLVLCLGVFFASSHIVLLIGSVCVLSWLSFLSRLVSYLVLLHLLCFILFYPVLSCFILFYPVLSCFILFYLVFTLFLPCLIVRY